MKPLHFGVVLAVILLVISIRVIYYNLNRDNFNGSGGFSQFDVNSTFSVTEPPKVELTEESIIFPKSEQKHHKSAHQTYNVEHPAKASEPVKNVVLPPCDDPIWCKIEMPPMSLYRFSPPTDKLRWRRAQISAATGEQVLLKKAVEAFPNYLDFMDGDITFRKYNLPADIFIDKKRDMKILTQRRLEEYAWENQGKNVLPSPYDYKTAERAPIVKIGYFAFSTEGGSHHFEGPNVGEASVGRDTLYKHWKAVKDQIKTPFILLHQANENWGLLSTFLPNRTIDWGRCCDGPEDKTLHEILNHPKTLAFLTNQHYNISHPKLISVPRGLPITPEHAKRFIWDNMRLNLKKTKKDNLVFTASSTWGFRPQIMKCIANKFDKNEFKGTKYGENGGGRFTQGEYYRQLSSARTGIALPGLGYDTFRLWECMHFGTVPVIERGVGMDKTLWRLPALIVDDFDLVTPELLRLAYVEAIYRADEFEYQRLTQSWWWTLFANISSTMKAETMQIVFPKESEEPNFMRPMVPFECAKTDSCGRGTMKTPKSSC